MDYWMARNFKLLEARMSPEALARSTAKADEMLKEMRLSELRKAQGLTQKNLAEILHVRQPTIAKMEKKTDMYISTLREHIEAMGGELYIIAKFPTGSVKIANFYDMEVM